MGSIVQDDIRKCFNHISGENKIFMPVNSKSGLGLAFLNEILKSNGNNFLACNSTSWRSFSPDDFIQPNVNPDKDV